MVAIGGGTTRNLTHFRETMSAPSGLDSRPFPAAARADAAPPAPTRRSARARASAEEPAPPPRSVHPYNLKGTVKPVDASLYDCEQLRENFGEGISACVDRLDFSRVDVKCIDKP